MKRKPKLHTMWALVWRNHPYYKGKTYATFRIRSDAINVMDETFNGRGMFKLVPRKRRS